MLNERRDTNCIGISVDRKYYHTGSTFIKRSLRPSEWQINPMNEVVHVPRQGQARILNEAAAMMFVADNTEIPFPTVHRSFEDEGRSISSWSMSRELAWTNSVTKHARSSNKSCESTLKPCTSCTRSIGGVSGFVVPPYRVTRQSPREV